MPNLAYHCSDWMFLCREGRPFICVEFDNVGFIDSIASTFIG